MLESSIRRCKCKTFTEYGEFIGFLIEPIFNLLKLNHNLYDLILINHIYYDFRKFNLKIILKKQVSAFILPTISMASQAYQQSFL